MIDLYLIAFGFSSCSLAAKSEARVEAGFRWQQDFEFGFEIRHLDVGSDPAIGFGEQMEFSVFGFESLNLGAWSPAFGARPVEELDPITVRMRCGDRQ